MTSRLCLHISSGRLIHTALFRSHYGNAQCQYKYQVYTVRRPKYQIKSLMQVDRWTTWRTELRFFKFRDCRFTITQNSVWNVGSKYSWEIPNGWARSWYQIIKQKASLLLVSCVYLVENNLWYSYVPGTAFQPSFRIFLPAAILQVKRKRSPRIQNKKPGTRYLVRYTLLLPRQHSLKCVPDASTARSIAVLPNRNNTITPSLRPGEKGGVGWGGRGDIHSS